MVRIGKPGEGNKGKKRNRSSILKVTIYRVGGEKYHNI
jgi:hypothetical protein